MRTFIAFVAIVIGSSVQAQVTEEKLALSRRVVSELGLEKQFQAQVLACLNPPADSSLNPLFEFGRNPGHFLGVSPKSAYWPQVEAAYRKYKESVCSYMTNAEFVEYTAKSYAEKTGIEALRAAVRFYESPQGRAFTVANSSVGVAMQGELIAKMHEATKRADAVIRESLGLIAGEYQRAPR